MLEKKQRKQCILFSDHPTLPRWKCKVVDSKEKTPPVFYSRQDHRRWAAFWLSWMHWRFPRGLERNRHKRVTLANSKRGVEYSLSSPEISFWWFFQRGDLRKHHFQKVLPLHVSLPKLEITCIISYCPFRIRDATEDMRQQNPKFSMHRIFTYMYHRFKPNVGRYSIHGEFGNVMLQNVLGVLFSTSRLPSFSGIWSICTLDDSVIFQHRMLARGEGRRRGTEAFCKVFQEWGAECVLDGYGMCFVACLSRYV